MKSEAMQKIQNCTSPIFSAFNGYDESFVDILLETMVQASSDPLLTNEQFFLIVQDLIENKIDYDNRAKTFEKSQSEKVSKVLDDMIDFVATQDCNSTLNISNAMANTTYDYLQSLAY
jgi:hypothetical protein